MSASRSSPTNWDKPNCLTAITSHCLAALPAKKSAFNSYMRQSVYHRNLKCIYLRIFAMLLLHYKG